MGKVLGKGSSSNAHFVKLQVRSSKLLFDGY